MNSGIFQTIVVSLIISTLLTFIVRRLAIAKKFVSFPRADRYNRNVIALGGGIAIFISVLLGLFSHHKFFGNQEPVSFFATIAVITVLFTLGLLDDIKGLSPLFKLIVQFACAGVAVVFADARVELFIHSKIITALMSMFWIVLLINAFNFLDNMDGASAGIASIVLAILASAAYLGGDMDNAVFCAVAIGSLLGFLIFNFPPAKIFMGDAGSFIVGFAIAIMTLRITYYNETSTGEPRSAVLIPLIAVAVPLYDFMSVTILRISQGKSPFVGDTQHFSHRLKRRGLSDTQVALTLYLATICTGLGAVFLNRAGFVQAILIFAQTIMILGIIAIFEKSNKKDSF